MKNILLKSLIVLLVAVLYEGVYAQQLPVMNHYAYNPYLYNPARTGQKDYGSLTANFKKQWVNMPQSPVTAILSVETPLQGEQFKNMGIGAMVYSDKMHIMSNIGGMISYAYHVRFSDEAAFKNRLSIGMSLGVLNRRFDYSQAQLVSYNDLEILNDAIDGTSFDFSAGLDYQYKDLHVGAAMLQGLNNNMKFIVPNDSNTINFVNSRHFLFTGSYRFNLGSPESKNRFYIEPVALGRLVPGLPFQAEATVLFGMTNIGWVGVGYRSSNTETATSAISATVGVDLNRRVYAAYTSDFAIEQGLNTSLGLQHEFMIAYRFGKNDKLEKELQKMKEDNEALKESLNNKTDSLKNELDGQKKEAEGLNKKLDDANKENDNLKEKVIKNEEDIEELRKQLADRAVQQPKNLGEIFFDPESDVIPENEKAKLDALKDYLDSNPEAEMALTLYGNANDEVDGEDDLATRRAKAISDYLEEKGANLNKVNIVPMGKNNPTVGKSDPENRIDLYVGPSNYNPNNMTRLTDEDPEIAPEGVVYKIQVAAVKKFREYAYAELREGELGKLKIVFESIPGNANRIYLVPNELNSDGTEGLKSKSEALRILDQVIYNSRFKTAFVVKVEEGEREIIRD